MKNKLKKLLLSVRGDYWDEFSANLVIRDVCEELLNILSGETDFTEVVTPSGVTYVDEFTSVDALIAKFPNAVKIWGVMGGKLFSYTIKNGVARKLL